jgi:hypothetical protein
MEEETVGQHVKDKFCAFVDLCRLGDDWVRDSRLR